MSEEFSRAEVISGVARRRRFTAEQKLAIVAETMQPGMSISYVARSHGLSPSLVFRWRRLMTDGGREAVRADDDVVPAAEARRLEERVRALERQLGRKTLEVEILKEALDLARGKKTDLAVQLAAGGRFPVKAVTETLGVARSNVVERVKAARPKRGPQIREGDLELTADIRRPVDERPTYGYRRIAALLRRERRTAEEPSVNAKRVYRLMKKNGLLLARHSGRRLARRHEGEVATPRSNIRWCSDALEFSCWNGEVVRVAFALDCHDREVIGWTATTAGISGEMIRDMMVECVETRFGSPRAPERIQWLTDNGSTYAAAKTIDMALALNLEPCFTPVESPESNGLAEAFVKTFKRDYVRVNPIPDAATAIAAVRDWMEDYNTVHPHSRLGYRSPREYLRAMSQPTACPV
ncbi:IS3 family transposase [Propylenella binzhouense]|uniref:IS3 family transposase n=1 Tax=Propylenella binzhouense TaxID=2555902 RepID=UPI001FEB3992|nr:IS3 family transposase [Propylenella binzhouense]